MDPRIREQAFLKGKQIAAVEAAQRLLDIGWETEKIAAVTSLSVAEVEEIADLRASAR